MQNFVEQFIHVPQPGAHGRKALAKRTLHVCKQNIHQALSRRTLSCPAMTTRPPQRERPGASLDQQLS